MFSVRYKEDGIYYWKSFDFLEEEARIYYSKDDALSDLHGFLLEAFRANEYIKENIIFELVDMESLQVIERYKIKPFNPLKKIK